MDEDDIESITCCDGTTRLLIRPCGCTVKIRDAWVVGVAACSDEHGWLGRQVRQ